MPRVQRPAGWWYPRVFIAGMLVVVAANAVLVYFALSTWSGLETTNHYRKGLAYNEALAATQRQQDRGWKMRLEFRPLATDTTERRGVLRATFSDRDNRPLADLAVEAEVVRPTHEGHDLSLSLRHQGTGVYAAEVVLPLPGQWDARVHASRRDEWFQAKQRLYLP
jgi:nitrogen fixation protein FixH